MRQGTPEDALVWVSFMTLNISPNPLNVHHIVLLQWTLPVAICHMVVLKILIVLEWADWALQLILMKTTADSRSSSVVPSAGTCTAGRTPWRTTSEESTTLGWPGSWTDWSRYLCHRRRGQLKRWKHGRTKTLNRRPAQLTQIKATILSKCDKIVILGLICQEPRINIKGRFEVKLLKLN